MQIVGLKWDCGEKRKGLKRNALQALSKVAGLTRLELATSGVTGRRSNQLNYNPAIFICGRRNRARTCDPRLVRPVLSQLSYPPKRLWTSQEESGSI